MDQTSTAANTPVSREDAIQGMFLAILRRGIQDHEKGKYGGYTLDQIGRELIASEEYYLLTREEFAARLFPKSLFVIGKGPLGHEIECDLRQPHVGMSMLGGHYEPQETGCVLSSVKSGMTVLDVGANTGYYTTMMAELVGPYGKVISFEPVGFNHLRLVSAITRNHFQDRVEVHKVATMGEPGIISMTYQENSTNMGGAGVVSEFQNLSAIDVVERVRGVTLDSIVGNRHVDFIKMDIEGAEPSALKGAKDLLSRSKPIVMMEFNEVQLKAVSGVLGEVVLEEMLSYGYQPYEMFYRGETKPFELGNLIQRIRGGIVNVLFKVPY